MTTIKDMIQKMDQIEASAKSTSTITEASLNISANAESAAEVGELLRVLSLGGVAQPAEPEMVGPAPCPICGQVHGAEETSSCGSSDEPEVMKLPAPDDREMMKRQLLAMDGMDKDVEEDWDNEPEEEYHSMSDQMASGDDLHKRKKQYAKAQDGDNAMAVESIKTALALALEAKKGSKPDFLDVDGDGDTEEPMKKAIKDKEEDKED